MMHGVNWTPERINKVRSYVSAGMNAREIAAEFGDVTRFSIIGLCDRQGIQLASAPPLWPQDKVDLLLTMRNSGSTVRQISGAIGMSVGSICKKLARLGLSRPRAKTNGDMSDLMRLRRKAKFKKSAKAEPPSELPFLGVTLEERADNQCHFPRGDEPPFLYCGQPKAEHSQSYCGFHHGICYTKPATQEQRQEAAREYQARAA